MRQFEMLQKAISLTADMDKKALDEVARVSGCKPVWRGLNMIRALFSAASGMNAQQMNVDNIANNLANSNTAGFKARRAQFQELMYQNMTQPGAQAGQQSIVPTGLQLGLGTRAASNEIVFTQGDFSQTSNPLDVVIQGNGFFQVLLPNGTLAYTRAGQFQVNNSGGVVDANGNLLQPSSHPAAQRPVGHHRHRWHGQLHAPQSNRRPKPPGRSSWRPSRIRRA